MLKRLKQLIASIACKPKTSSIDKFLKIKPAEEWINPPSPAVSEALHELALARIAYEDMLWNIMHDMANYIKFKEGLLPETSYWYKRGELELRKSALDAIADFEEGANIDDNLDWWHGYIWENMKNGIRGALTEPHAGDCVAFPCTCMRCYAEEKYKLPITATFTKSEGNKLYHEVLKQRSQNNSSE